MSFPATAEAGKPIEDDWIDRPLPLNVEIGDGAYVQGAFSFLPFLSERSPGLVLGEGSGAYDFASFVVGPRGSVEVGAYTCLNACYLICDETITLGDHCLVGWGAVITDDWAAHKVSASHRREALRIAARRPDRWIAPLAETRPVVIEDNVWVGFESVIMPGVRLGRGCIVGSRSVVLADVPPYAVVTGDPCRIVRQFEPDDTPQAREEAFIRCLAWTAP